jgi:DNA-binding GntR family transcriptional regulator
MKYSLESETIGNLPRRHSNHEVDSGDFLYERIAERIVKEIGTGFWRNGEALPSETSLTESYGVSRKTVRHALRLVEQSGYIAKSQGKRSTIKCNKVEKLLGAAVEFPIEAARAGLKSKTRLHGVLVRQATTAEVSLLQLARGTTIAEIKRTRYLNYLPAVIQTSTLSSTVANQLSNIGHPDASLYDELRRRMSIRVGPSEDTLSAVLAGAAEAAALNVPEGTSLISMQRKAFTVSGSVVEISISIIRPEFFVFRLNRAG